MFDAESNTEQHFKQGSMHVAGLGWLYFLFLSLLVCVIGVSISETESAIGWTLALWIPFVLLSFGFYFWRRKKNFERAVSLRKDLHDLKEQEFKLRFEEAKMNGQLDRWKKSDDYHNNQ